MTIFKDQALKSRGLTQNVVELIQIVLSRKDWSVGQHLSQDATHRPDVYGLGIALRATGTKTSGLQYSETDEYVSVVATDKCCLLIRPDYRSF